MSSFYGKIKLKSEHNKVVIQIKLLIESYLFEVKTEDFFVYSTLFFVCFGLLILIIQLSLSINPNSMCHVSCIREFIFFPEKM